MDLTSDLAQSTLKIYPTNLDTSLDVQVMDKLYTIIEVATKLGLSDKTLRRWEEAGKFRPSRTLGNQRRYSLEDLQILDAIKHGTITSQSELLTIDQAAKLAGVSTATLARWENSGKIHPLVTAGNTYYPRPRLMEKLDELKSSPYQEPISDEPVWREPAPVVRKPKLASVPLVGASPSAPTLNRSIAINLAVTASLLLIYHLIFGSSITRSPVSPVDNSGQVQGATISEPDPRLDDLIAKFQSHLAEEMLGNAGPAPVTTINLDNTSLVSGTVTLKKGQSQTSVTNTGITENSLVTISSGSDFAPAKKYWVTTSPGSFTIHTDFPVSTDSLFNYQYLAIIQP